MGLSNIYSVIGIIIKVIHNLYYYNSIGVSVLK